MLLTQSRRAASLSQEKLALQLLGNSIGGAIGKTLVHGTKALGQGVYGALKDPTSRNVLGTAAAVGIMGGAGFARGSHADDPYAPERLNEPREQPFQQYQ